MDINEQDISRIVREVMRRLENPPDSKDDRGEIPSSGILFDTMEEAIDTAVRAQEKFISLGLALRRKAVKAMRDAAGKQAEYLAKLAAEETGMGRWEDKVRKNLLAAEKTPGVEDVEPEVFTGDRGLTLVERGPFGVIGAVTPSTNPTSTIINNSISIISAGNSVVYAPHPAAGRSSQESMRILTEALLSAGAPPGLITGMKNPSIEGAEVMFAHPATRLLIATGGPAVVRVIMKSGKKVIAAGPGNPPVVIDETADPVLAAESVISGASFDNGVLCTAEKEVLLSNNCREGVLKAMRNSPEAHELTSGEMDRLASAAIKKGGRGVEPVLNRDFVGKDAAIIAGMLGISVSSKVRLLWGLVDVEHPYMWTEQLMPVLPFAETGDIERSIDLAVEMEGGNGHTAVMHSQDVSRLTRMARKAGCSIFVKNGPSYMGLGMGEGFATLSIATPTGDGLVSARHFTRPLRCVLVDNFRIT